MKPKPANRPPSQYKTFDLNDEHMAKDEFKKRLSKCSKDAITDFLYSRFRYQNIINEIELIHYEKESKRLVYEMTKQTDLMNHINFDSAEVKVKWLKAQNRRFEANKKLEKLNKWFNERKK